MSEPRPRAREVGIRLGLLPTGTRNAITDVAGVRVGQATIIRGEGKLVPGQGPVRTGVTAILPHGGDLFMDKVVARVETINGFGEVANALQVNEMGWLEGPIMLTNTLNVGAVSDYVMQWAMERSDAMGVTTWGISPVVSETFDGSLNDIRGRHVKFEHVLQAIETARDGPVEEGTVGGGTGMTCYGFKGGTGTASRVVSVEHGDSIQSWIVGVLVQSNFGSRELLMIDGVPVGRELRDWQPELPVPPKEGSIVMVMATDAPLDFRQLGRVARRCGAGLARTGSIYGNTSGDFVIAFSTANKVPHEASGLTRTIEVINEESVTPINALFQAAAEATEEAIVNSLFKATTVIGRDGNTRHALPLELTLDIMRRYGGIA
ncbi:MAG: P1 family peptidase [Chloroflexi bacterium]|nr:MAG: P1 family peptidase [Chloroflexota bacterium]